MKYGMVLVAILMSSVAWASDGETRQLLVDARTDHDNVLSIKSVNLDDKDIDDATLHSMLTQASSIGTFSAQRNILKNPQPVPCVFLTTLNLSHGNIKRFALGDWIWVMPNLRILNLAHNSIQSIASDSDTTYLSCCETREPWHSDRLQTLDLSHNQLTIFDLAILNNATSLTHADLSNNNIDTAKDVSFIRPRTACTVLLYNNNFDVIQRQHMTESIVRSTKEYEDERRAAMLCGGLSGIVLGLGGEIPLAMNYATQWHPAASVFAALGIFGISIVLGVFGGYKLAQCSTPEALRTYEPFVFVFDRDDDSGDEVGVDLDKH